MVFIRSCIAVLIFTGLLFAQKADGAAPKPWSLGVNTGFVSKYLWRGANLHDRPAFQPALEFSAHGIRAEFWASYNLGDEAGSGFAQADYNLSYSGVLPFLRSLEAGIGYSHNTYPTLFGQEASWKMEWSLRLCYDIISAPTLTYSIVPVGAYDDAQSQYFDLGFSHEFDVRKDLAVTPVLQMGFAMENDLDDNKWSSNFSALGIGISSTYRTIVDVTPALYFQLPLSTVADGLGNRLYERDFYFGLNVGYEL